MLAPERLYVVGIVFYHGSHGVFANLENFCRCRKRYFGRLFAADSINADRSG
jgi:hypothetical protein